MSSLEKKLEALLFYRGEPESRDKLAKLLEVTPEEIDTAAESLKAVLATRGVRLLSIEDQLELVTAPETSEVITRARKEELSRDLGKAGADTLAIVLYRGSVTRADIEYIRGVNSGFILRNLLIRGLVHKIPNPKNSRSVLYQPTAELLKHLGVTAVEELPEIDSIKKELDAFEARKEQEEKKAAEEVGETLP